MKTGAKKLAALLAGGAVMVTGCSSSYERSGTGETSVAGGPAETPQLRGTNAAVKAVAELSPTEGNRARGTIYFVDEPQGTRITGEIAGLSPGEHGFHIHEKGDCSPPDASSAGGHFNPTAAPHGGPRSSQRHVGDLGNITAGQDGRAHISEVAIPPLEFSGPNSIVGKALVVHAKEDDLTTQPSGDSGARVACGLIESQGSPTSGASQTTQ